MDSFGASTADEQLLAESDGVRCRSSGGDDVPVSSDYDDWTDGHQRETSEPVEPVAGCSQSTDYSEELQHDVTVSRLELFSFMVCGYLCSSFAY